jgi:hypothetical protein
VFKIVSNKLVAADYMLLKKGRRIGKKEHWQILAEYDKSKILFMQRIWRYNACFQLP